MISQIEIGTGMNPFHLFESERELKLYIGRSIRIMRQFFMVVKTVHVIAETECLMPLHTKCLPVLIPFHLIARMHEELHLHLFKLPHTEDKLTGYYLITERLAYLCDTERNLHPPGFLDIQEINENALSILMGVLSSSEEARIKQQKPLQISLLVFVGIQLIFFNGIICALVVYFFRLNDQSIIGHILDFLKYYVGAVLVELIGMIMFITKSTFTSPAQDIIKGFFSRKP